MVAITPCMEDAGLRGGDRVTRTLTKSGKIVLAKLGGGRDAKEAKKP